MRDRRQSPLSLHRRWIRSCKKNTLAVFFCFFLTFLLLTLLLVLLHTNHRIGNLQAKAEFTPSDCYIDGLTWEQAESLRRDEEIEKAAVEQAGSEIFQRNSQRFHLMKGDDASMTMLNCLREGRLPQKQGEVAAEEWVLLNLGILPRIGQTFSIEKEDTGEEQQVTLTGILSDIYPNKKYGLLSLYAPLEEKKEGENYLVYLRFRKGTDYLDKTDRLRKEYQLEEDQLKECPAREEKAGLYRTDAQIVAVILLICMTAFYGVYRIASITREKQYGILRAVGMGKNQMKQMILLELYQIFAAGAPAGIGAGLLLSQALLALTGDRDLEIYLYNERIQISPVIPGVAILVCAGLTALLVGIAGLAAAGKVLAMSPVEAISGHGGSRERKGGFAKRANPLKEKKRERGSSKSGALFFLARKYMTLDVKTSFFAVLTICLGAALFTGLLYQARIQRTFRADTKEMMYLNGDYSVTMLYYDQNDQGLSRESAKEIEKLPGIQRIATSSGLPIRVIEQGKIKKNEAYYDEYNRRREEIYGFPEEGFDGKDQVYKSLLLGYNTTALQELEKYVISGSFDPEALGEDEVILSVARTDDTKENDTPGNYREGTPLMDYQAGDEITIKYREDRKTSSKEYERFQDAEEPYVYKTYRIAAIVSFAYMYDCTQTVYPVLITGDKQLKEAAPESAFQCVYADARGDLSEKEQKTLEEELIKITSRSPDVSARSMISEIRQNEGVYRKQMVYIYGIAAVAFLLVLIHMTNHLRYRMQARSREICMLRALGMSVSMTRRMILFENLILGALGCAGAFLLSQFVLRYLYRISQMRSFGHAFHYPFDAYFLIAAASLLLCAALSGGILKEWKTRNVAEGISRAE